MAAVNKYQYFEIDNKWYEVPIFDNEYGNIISVLRELLDDFIEDGSIEDYNDTTQKPDVLIASYNELRLYISSKFLGLTDPPNNSN